MSPLQVCFSEGGERFAAIGQGGLAAVWRLDAPQFTRSDSGPLARSDWCHQVACPLCTVWAALPLLSAVCALLYPCKAR